MNLDPRHQIERMFVTLGKNVKKYVFYVYAHIFGGQVLFIYFFNKLGDNCVCFFESQVGWIRKSICYLAKHEIIFFVRLDLNHDPDLVHKADLFSHAP
jgi:hypothetical protein